MKTPAQWWAGLKHGDNVIADITARDAEHRAELDQCQTDLKSARHSLLQSDNQVARLVAENDRLKGELAKETKRSAALEALVDMERQVRKETENTLFFVRAELLKVQDDLLQGANREVMAEALIERLRGELGEALENIERMKARYSEQSRELAAMEQERNNWRQQRVDVGLRYDLFKINHKGQGCGRREGDAALEAKGEPGTHADDICARPKCLSPRHYNIHGPERGGHAFVEPKGAKP